MDITPPKNWICKRKITMRIFFVQSFYLGVEHSVFVLTVWAYIKDMFKVKDKKLLYSLTTSAYLVSAICFGIVIGKIVDQYRCIRSAFIVSNVFLVLGNIMYAIPFTPAFPVLGRLLAGFGAPLKSIIIGEIARSYPSNELNSKLTAIGMAFGSGFVGGPAINLGFLSTNFYIGEWHITKTNVTGGYMAVIFIILQIAAFFFVSDLSKEFDLKQELENCSVKKTFLQHEDETLDKEDRFELLKSILSYLKRFDTCFILVLSFFFSYKVAGYDVVVPMITLDILKWSLFDFNILTFCLCIVAISAMIAITVWPLSDRGFYSLVPCAFMGFSLTQINMSLIIIFHNHEKLVIFLWVIGIIIYPIITIGEEIFLPTMFAKMVPSKFQTTAENVRQGFGRFGTLVALMTAPFLLRWFVYVSVVVVFACVIGFAIYMRRLEYFKNYTQ